MHKAKTGEFWSRHGMAVPRASALAEPAIVALDAAHQLFAVALENAPEPKETSGMIRRALENLSNRLYEQAAGMLVCLGTGSAAAAETVARTVIEGAFNLQFIVSKDHEARLFAFFYEYLLEHDKKLDDWRKLEETKPQTPAQAALKRAIAEHGFAHQKMSDFVKSLGNGLGFGRAQTVSHYWPKSLYKRCEQMDKAGDYLTSYHRLSASSHINAEETIRWLFGSYCSAVGRDSQSLEKLSIETVSYTTMMTRMAVLHYIDANTATCRALNARYDEVSLRETTTQLSKSIDDIASAAGAPT